MLIICRWVRWAPFAASLLHHVMSPHGACWPRRVCGCAKLCMRLVRRRTCQSPFSSCCRMLPRLLSFNRWTTFHKPRSHTVRVNSMNLHHSMIGVLSTYRRTVGFHSSSIMPLTPDAAAGLVLPSVVPTVGEPCRIKDAGTLREPLSGN